MKNNPANYLDKLVDQTWLKEKLNTNNIHFIEVGYNDSTDFLKGHLERASYLDISTLEGGPLWNIYSQELLLTNLSRLFPSSYLQKLITETTVLYGNNQSCVCRAGLILMGLGFYDIRIVNGGKKKIKTQDLALTCKLNSVIYRYNKYNDSDFDIIKNSLNPKDMNMDYLKVYQLDLSAFEIISIRSLNEFNGLVSGYSYFDNKGSIPHSIHGMDIDYYRNPDESMVQPEVIINTLKLNNGKKKVFYCGTGWRASEVAFYVQALGYECYVYDGGWYEWSEKAK